MRRNSARSTGKHRRTEWQGTELSEAPQIQRFTRWLGEGHEPKENADSHSLAGSGFPFSFWSWGEVSRWYITLGQWCSRLSEGGISLLGWGTELHHLLHSSVSGGWQEWQKSLSHYSFHCCPRLTLCFMRWPRWGQPDMVRSTSLNGCSCHPRWSSQEAKDVDFPSFPLVCYSPLMQKAGVRASSFLGSSTWPLTALAGLLQWSVSKASRRLLFFALADRVR